MNILVTGGAGFIGSHTCVELLKENHEVVIVDNFSNSSPISIKNIESLTNKKVKFYNVDLLDKAGMNMIFEENSIDSVIHFAGLKSVGESVERPLKYYSNNITGTLVLIELMEKYNIYNLVFSSSATVYGNPTHVPITEEFELKATNPYGRTKLIIEEILKDLPIANEKWSIAILRYFNPIGAHKSGQLGEDPNGIPNNLMPFITQVAIGKLKELNIFGNDYPTTDGTGVRDYIHVVDLAKGHLKALNKVIQREGIETYNLGTGLGHSVLDVVKAFEISTNIKIPYRFITRRPGDIAICFADPTKAERELGWKAEKGILEMCTDAWRWQSGNPNGFEDKKI
ncbi:UDP-glucose 4-epimerase GalE [Bacillus sp. KH172YL63]|uniref:UDP-glucose 4-epimerase GalE n=1 Tax=Bacillus sp. KH172YL63 TaxID=2709784 RepID=UPI0013E450AE|nr:UDP-glucose 4-epimerase GalE [Bacillus sp. KH172YL63]BCB05860.1 UDP-glucose 4-epimerase [Bacillus sp. KH172YL63]